MATSFPVGIYPPFNTRSTRSFPTTKKPETPEVSVKKRITKTKTSKEASDEYIRNLQQQIYLLELETRYLRSSKARGECGNNGNNRTNTNAASDFSSMINNNSSSLNDVLNGLKYKYVELQEKNKQDLKKLEDETERVKGENAKKDLELGKQKEEIEMLRNEINLLKEHSVDEKKDLFNENTDLKKKLENINSEVSRSDLSYKRVLKEKEELLDTINKMRMDYSTTNEKCEDLTNINEHLKHKILELEKEIDELKEKNFEQANIISNIDLDARQLLIDSIQKEKIKLMANVKRLEVAYAEEKQLREKIINDRDKVIEENVALNTQIEELKRKLESDIKKGDESFNQRRTAMQSVEKMQKQLDKYKDEIDSLRIANDTKDKRLMELKEKISNQESAVNKVLESKAVYEDTISEIKTRLDKAEEQLTKASKDKCDLQKENENLKKSVNHQRNEVTRLNKDLDAVHKKLKEYKNDRNANKEIKQLIDQIESSGDNYIRLMKSIRSCLDKTKDQSVSSIDIFLNNSS